MLETLIFAVQQNATSIATGQAGNSFFANLRIGAILGFAATLIGSFGVWYLSRLNRRKRLRRAIVAELQKQEEKIGRIVESLETDGPIDEDEESNEYEIKASDLPPSGSIPTVIYQSNASNIGELPSEKVDDIVDYYSALQTQKATIEAIRNEEQVLTADKRDLHQDMPDLDSKRIDLKNKLEPSDERIRDRIRFW
jgi:hypothetical protein